jgi:transcriptional regulator of heat shock response
MDELKELTQLLARLDERLVDQVVPSTHQAASVYIGEEIPFMSARHSSMVVRDVELPAGETMTLIIIGPKRMPYHRNVALLNAVADIIEQQGIVA